MRHLTNIDAYFKADSLPYLSSLSALEELYLATEDSSAIGPSMLPGFPATLTWLEVMSPVEAGIMSILPTGLQHLQILDGVEGPASMFLAGMARLHLTQLYLCITGGTDWPAPGPAYSGLTASSSLVVFEVDFDGLPAGIWPHVFPAGRTLPHLTGLITHRAGVEASPPSAWGAADVPSLVSCCPDLHKFVAALQAGSHVSLLHKLTSLTECEVYSSTTSSNVT